MPTKPPRNTADSAARDRGESGLFNQALESSTKRKLTLSNHSLKLDTSLFSLDLRWRRLEMEQEESGPSQEAPARASKGSMPPPSFEEIMRRQQIADLLSPEPCPPPGSELIMAQAEHPPVLIPVRLAYPDQERPLAGFRSLNPSTV
jgi:hypothetical protein